MVNPSDQVYDIAHHTTPSLPTQNSYQYPFAAAPDIIRSNQKDTYFQSLLFEQLSTILRNLYGARFVHTHTTEARTITELLYLSLTTLIGNRTLGEEYCDIVPIEADTRRLPSPYRRAGYILASVLLPYSLARLLPALRHRLRRKLESNRRRSHKAATLSSRLQTYLLTHLDALTSPSPIYAASLATFYFSGAYYHLSKRLLGLRYIFTRRIRPSEQRVGYEVLGVLLVLQVAVQAWLHLHHTLRSSSGPSPSPPVPANAASAAGGSAVLDGGVEIALNPDAYASENVLLFESTTAARHPSAASVEKATHTPVLERPRYGLADAETLRWIRGRQQRKCTLCLEEMRDPSVTTCGHVFCWTCIGDWIREKPECPLCRQVVLGQHVLPLRG